MITQLVRTGLSEATVRGIPTAVDLAQGVRAPWPECIQGRPHCLNHRFCPHFPGKHLFTSHQLLFNKYFYRANLISDRPYCNIYKSVSTANGCENAL